jgi:hypothetical protein
MNPSSFPQRKVFLRRNPVVRLPDGCRILSFHIIGPTGARIGKISGDLNVETESQIREKFKPEDYDGRP